MDNKYYSQETIDNFLKDKLCQNDPVLMRYMKEGSSLKFRKRLANMATEQVRDNIEQVVYTTVTDAFRDVIYKVVGELTKEMKPWGDVIVSGGEAINYYLPIENRVVTSDIDTKFTPYFVTKNGKITKRNSKFFGYLQAAKITMWDFLGRVAYNMSKKDFDKRFELIKNSTAGKMLGIKPTNVDNRFTRRYNLKYKEKQSNRRTDKISAGDVLIDVEIMSLDLLMRYFDPKQGYTNKTLAILDVAYMRPGELGYEIAITRKAGLTYRNPLTGRVTKDKRILVAGKKFLIEDIYVMSSLGLRPKKKAKDHKRMVLFARDVLGLDVKSANSNLRIFDKALDVLKNEPTIDLTKRPVITQAMLDDLKTLDPLKYEKWTTRPTIRKVRFLHVGLRAPRGLQIKGFKETSSGWRFDLKTEKWVKDTRRKYIKDEVNYRLNKETRVNMFDVDYLPIIDHLLYSFNPRRNKWLSPEIVSQAVAIQAGGILN